MGADVRRFATGPVAAHDQPSHHSPVSPSGANSNRRIPRSTCCPGSTATRRTTPLREAVITNSIFMDSIITTVWFRSTLQANAAHAASLAEWERDSIRGRTRAGVDRAAAEGRTGGRPPALDSEKTQAVRDFLEGGRSVSAAARTFTFNVSRATIRAVRDWTCTRRTGEANVDRR